VQQFRNEVEVARLIDNPTRLILDKAKELMTSEGYDGLNMRRLSMACGIALGTIYNYYPTKRDLVVAMMVEHWNGFFFSLASIASSEGDFFSRLRMLRDELEQVLIRFREVWLKPELYKDPDYVEHGVKTGDAYVEKLVSFIHTMWNRELEITGGHLKIEPMEASRFVVMNLVSLLRNPLCRYETFEEVLRTLMSDETPPGMQPTNKEDEPC